ncbi:sorting nexin-17 isoform X2 [Schistocerca gregaria]|uniref:sorting nexin-17 isoform X2 n=1 Tax=Schistocerca gregaria TaxID=7010 RepID=UPI00211E8706|nr:sorting nexin-17 isoform X2 [Schistocerca gregaria]
MHFSIPDTEEFTDDGNSTYMGYNIHVNGVFHCSVRYRQLHNLHEQLKKEFGVNNLPTFPPKKLLPLSSSQLEERRALLEKYIQAIGQDPRLVNSDLFNGFLLSAQQETSCEKSQEVNLDVYLMNGYRILLKVLTTERSDQVLEKVCQQINLPSEYVYYFSLFLIKREDDGDVTVLRKLQDFESPYISQKSIQGVHRLVLRKSYWDPSYDIELMSDKVALNLLYVQTVADVEKGWILSSKETQKHLASLQARGAKKEHGEGSSIHSNSSSTSDNSQPQLELSFEYLMSKDKLQWITIASEQAILMSVCLQAMVDELLLKKTGMKRRQPSDNSRKGSWSYMKRDGSSQLISISQSTSTDGIATKPSAENGDTKPPAKLESTSSMKRLSEKLASVSLKSSIRLLPHPLVENDAFEGIGDDDL